MKLAAVLICLLGAFAVACASWGSARWARLSSDKFVVLKGASRFVLVRDVTWDLLDPGQTKAFDAWRKQSGLPADLGALVSGVPAERESKLVAKLELSEGSTASAPAIEFDVTTYGTMTLDLAGAADGYTLTAGEKRAFEKMAGYLKFNPSDFLTAITGDGGAITETSAWKSLVSRLSGGHDEFVFLRSGKALVWLVSGGQLAPPPTQPAKPAAQKPKPPPVEPASQTNPIVPLVIGLLVVLGLGFGIFRAFHNPRGRSLRPISAHEVELLAMVREEAKSGKWRAGAKDPEGFVVGRMMEAFRKMEGLQKEIQTLAEYRKFQTQHKEYERKLADLTRELEAKQAEMAQLRREADEGKRSAAETRTLSATVSEANKLIDELAAWCGELSVEIGEIAKQNER
jgi:hypothetical protein